MAKSFSPDVLKRALRPLGNKSHIKASHPDGNKSTMQPGKYGRAASSQFASANRDDGAYQKGATFSGKGPGEEKVTPVGQFTGTSLLSRNEAVDESAKLKVRPGPLTPDAIKRALKKGK